MEEHKLWAKDANFKKNKWIKRIQDCRGIKERMKSLQAIANIKEDTISSAADRFNKCIRITECYNK